MQQMVVPPVETEIEHDAGARRLISAAPQEPARRLRRTEQFLVRTHGVHLGDRLGDRTLDLARDLVRLLEP